jgi:hypothetical protein
VTFDEVAALSVEGLNKSAIARAKRIAWNTVHRWLEKAAAFCRRFSDRKIAGIAITELQADEIRTRGLDTGHVSGVDHKAADVQGDFIPLRRQASGFLHERPHGASWQECSARFNESYRRMHASSSWMRDNGCSREVAPSGLNAEEHTQLSTVPTPLLLKLLDWGYLKNCSRPHWME